MRHRLRHGTHVIRHQSGDVCVTACDFIGKRQRLMKQGVGIWHG